MVAFNFNLGFYAYSDFTGSAATTNTVSYPVGTTFALSSGATPVTLNIDDDDQNPSGSPANEFSDGYIDTPGDGSTPSTANNDQVLTAPVTVNGTTYAAGSQVELEFQFTTTTGETFWTIRIDGDNVGISGPTLPTPGTSYEVASSADGSETPISDVQCYLQGTMIITPQGEIPVETLQAGDLVQTRDHGFQPIRWIKGNELDGATLRTHPRLRPIRISAGALGCGTPSRDLVVSPQHRLLVRSKIAKRMFETGECLVPAKKLLGLEGVSVADDLDQVTYFHFICDRHEVIVANGAWAETLFLGAQVAGGLEPSAMDEIVAIFGETVFDEQAFARYVPAGKQTKHLLERHIKNDVSIFEETL